MSNERLQCGWQLTLILFELLLFPFVFLIGFPIMIYLGNKYRGELANHPKVLQPPYSPYIWSSAVAPVVAVCSVPFVFRLMTDPHTDKSGASG